ncbi:zinc-dependent metalloprotease family protein [Thiofilum flexile]|uniref:zinc-dependent metalloprotease family protein n=1 Tax=Thiofilum flexile TaxID=125627 RepID=UPI00036A4AE7|nr:zinc-dependent metalloprotease family protein [Thiofilum flexile]
MERYYTFLRKPQMYRYPSHSLAFFVLVLVYLLSLFSTNAFAAEKIFQLGTSSPSAMGSASGIIPTNSVQLNSGIINNLTIGTEVGVPLPSGQITSGKVTNIIAGTGKNSATGLPETSRTIVSLANNGGAATLIKRGNAISELLVYDNTNKTIHKAIINNNGTGQLIKDNLSKYICLPYPVAPPAPAPIPKNSAAIPDVTSLKSLQSKPGASKVLYIDYWGGTLTGTVWNDYTNSGNPIVYTPYSSDSDTTNFSEADRYLMWLGFNEAAEDYAAFGINVTTNVAIYNATPSANRSRIIATTTDYFYPGYGGVAFIGAFRFTTDYSKTAWVWNRSAGSLGMTISHEAGHQMGLEHDGTNTLGYYQGHGVWGPIMGAPFNKPYVQWSKGEYLDANNNENDFTTIASVLGITGDDAGNTAATATTLTLPATNKQGYIRPNGLAADVDVYKFTLSSTQTVTVKAQPALGAEGESIASNLAMNAKLTNSSGTLIAQALSSAVSPLSPSTNKLLYTGSLAAGTYYLTIDAVSPNTNWSAGFGEYGNEGLYRFTVSTATVPTPKMTSPTPNTKLASTTQTFTWSTNGATVTKYRLYVGNTLGGSSYHNSGELANTITSRSVSGLPSNNSTVYVRLQWNTGSVWKYADYTYTATGSTTPSITSPTNKAIFTSTSQLFKWSANGASNVKQYSLQIGSTVGAKDIYNSGILTSTTLQRTASNLPQDGRTLYVRFWYYRGSAHPIPKAGEKIAANISAGTWYYRDYTYKAVTLSGFNEQFNGNISKWLTRSGIWSNISNLYIGTSGRSAAWNHVIYSPTTYSKVDYSALIKRTGSNTSSSANLTIRGDGTVDSTGACYNCYLFQYTNSGYYSVWKVINGYYTALQSWTSSSSIYQNSWNTLRVVAVGTSLKFYINGTLVWSGTDSSRTSGYVGMSMAYSDTLTADWATLTIPSGMPLETILPDQTIMNKTTHDKPANYNPAESPQ